MVGLTITGRELDFSVPLKYRPLRVDVDPESDIFRRLLPGEIPPAVSGVLGAERMLVVLPSSATEAMRKAYINLAVDLSRSAEGIVSVAMDDELAGLPKDRSAVVLGWENRFTRNSWICFLLRSRLTVTLLPSMESPYRRGATLLSSLHRTPGPGTTR